MGRSLDVALVYGDVHGGEIDEIEWPWNAYDEETDEYPFDNDFDSWFNTIHNIPEVDYSDFPERRTFDADDEWRNAYDVWKSKPDVVARDEATETAIKAWPFDIEYGGTDDWSYEVLYLKGTRVNEDWVPLELPLSFAVDEDDLAHAHEVAERIGLSWKPRLLVVPSYA